MLSGAAKAWKGSEAFSWLYACVSCLSVWSQGPDGVLCEGCQLSPTHSFFLSLFLFLSLYFFHYFFFSLFSLFYFHLSFFFKQARADTFLKQGYSFGWLELIAWRYAISPTLGLLRESQVCNVGVSFWVCSHSKEHQSVQLMQSLCSRASYVPCSS